MSEFLDLKRFKKQSKIGQGSFGQVFKVVENDTEDIYAAKISFTKLDEIDKKFFTNLKREVNILSKLNHPSVLKFIGYSPIDFNQNSFPVIITEYSPNGSLEDILKLERRSISHESWSDTKKLINIYGIASAMKYLHSHKIIHRDLKPANILEDDELFPKIADFGLSKIVHSNAESMTSQSTIGFKGTPIYNAPEIWLYYDYSKAGDVYSFSLIFYEVFSLNQPFKNYELDDFYKKVIQGGERPEFVYPIASCYTDLIKKCWSQNPEERPTFDEIVEELKTNKEFILDTIDEDEFLDYVSLVDETENLFYSDKTISLTEENKDSVDFVEDSSDQDKKLETIVKKKDLLNDMSGEKDEINEPSDKNDEITVTVKTFNSLPLKSQELTISRIIEREPDNGTRKTLLCFEKLLNYLNQMNGKTDLKYVSIPTKDEEITIEEFFDRKSKISLSYDAIEMINEHLKSNLTEFFNYLDKFDQIHIEIKYPTNVFDNIYEQVLKEKAKYGGKILINIFITGIDKTDMKFRNDVKIDSVRIDNDVNEIIGEQIGFRNSGGGSFHGCSSLRKIAIPSSVTSIGDCSFILCSLLKQITIPSSVTSIGELTFYRCLSLSKISFASPSSLDKIKSKAFYGCSSLTQIFIPSSVTEIMDYAFFNCTSLNQISIPSSVTKIGKCNFVQHETITLSDDMTNIPANIFQGNSLLKHISIPSSVTSIGNNAFRECSSLAQISIPSSVTSIENFAFYRCSSLTQITIPSSITKIGENSFERCLSLTKISIPSSVTSIENSAFRGCSSLTQITIPSSVTLIGNFAFYGCKSLTQITIPSSVTSIGNYAFAECSSLAQITIPSSVTKIGNSTFSECSSLTQITIPSSVTSIENDAFSFCSSLTQITIPSSVIKIGDSAFKICTSLSQLSFEIPSSVTKIGNNAFKGCSSLTQITIPSSVTSIGNNAFSGCSSLTQIPIPTSVKSTQGKDFSGCSSLTKAETPLPAAPPRKYAFPGLSFIKKSATPFSGRSFLANLQEGISMHNKKTKSIPNSPIFVNKEQKIDQLFSDKNSHDLIQYMHETCDNDMISKVYEKYRKSSPDFYISLINEGILINDAVSHYKYATLCIIESSKNEGLKTKLDEAVNHLEAAIKNGYLFSYLLLSFVYHDLYKNDVKAFNAVRDGANQGEKYCKCLIGYFIAHGIGTEKDFSKGVSIIISNKIPEFYQQFATDIGIYYSLLVDKQNESENTSYIDNVDKKSAFKWFEIAFKKSKTKATINNLGVCYLKGYGTDKNIEKAKEILGLDPNLMHHLDFIYEEENQLKLVNELIIESEQDHINTQNLLENQNDVKSDLNFSKKEAEKGNIEAQEFLAMKYSKENDTENFDKYCQMLIKNGSTRIPLEYAANLYKCQKFEQAFRYFSILSNVNHPIARYYLGIMKFYGHGCVQNKNESFNILNELSKKGIDKATVFIEDHFD